MTDEPKKRYLVDIETYRNYFFVGIKLIGMEKRAGYELSNRATFDRAWMRRFILQRRIVTFNGNSYDLPVLLYACTELPGGGYPTNEMIKEVSDRIILGRVRYWEVESVIGFRVPMFDMDHIDLIEPQPNPFASLKILNGRLHGKQMQDLPFEPERILTHEEMDLVSHYCLQNDLDASENLWDAMKEPIELREALGAELGMDLRSKSDTQMGLAIIKHRAEAVLGRKINRPEFKIGQTFKYRPPGYIKFKNPTLQGILDRLNDHTFVVASDGKVNLPSWLADTPIRFASGLEYSMGIGGLHSTESNRSVASDDDYVLIDADVASYYPAIILSLGLYPDAIGPKFIEIYRSIREDRIAAKKKAQRVKSEISDIEKEITKLQTEITQIENQISENTQNG